MEGPLESLWGTQTMELLPHMKIVRKRGATPFGDMEWKNGLRGLGRLPSSRL